MKIGRVRPNPVKVPQRIERKVKTEKEKAIPVKLPQKKETNVPT